MTDQYCSTQGRECIERLEITGIGDPSGRGLGFSYLRVAPKPPISSALVKKKAAAARGGSAVTGTDADLRRLSMDAAREVCFLLAKDIMSKINVLE
jgi:transcription initiation factor TFIID subunit 1